MSVSSTTTSLQEFVPIIGIFLLRSKAWFQFPTLFRHPILSSFPVIQVMVSQAILGFRCVLVILPHFAMPSLTMSYRTYNIAMPNIWIGNSLLSIYIIAVMVRCLFLYLMMPFLYRHSSSGTLIWPTGFVGLAISIRLSQITYQLLTLYQP